MTTDLDVYSFDEGPEPSKGEYRYFSNPDGSVSLRRWGVSPRGTAKWYDVPEDRVPPGQTMSGGNLPEGSSGSQGRVNNAELSRQRRARTEAEEDALKGEEYLYRKGAAQAVPAYARPGIHAMEEFRKLGVGAAEISDFLDAAEARLLSNIPGLEESMGKKEMASMESSAQRAKDEAIRDELFAPFHEETDLSKIGMAAPYAITNYFPGPQFASRIGRAYSGVKEGVKNQAREAGGRFSRGVRRLSNMDARNPVSKSVQSRAKELEDLVIDPIEIAASRSKVRPPVDDYFRKDIVPRLGGDVALGAVEGGVHYDESVLEGALSSMLGHTTGRVLGPRLEPGPNLNTPHVNDTLSWWKDQGFRVDPGMDSGRPELQTLFANARTDRKYSDFFNQIDRANNSVILDVAGRAAGLDKGQLEAMSPIKLQSHIKGLKDEYDQLVEGTTGKLKRSDVDGLKSFVEDNSKYITDPNTLRRLDLFQEEFNRIIQPRRDRRGRFKGIVFDGKDYQQLREKLKQAGNSARDSSNVDDQAAIPIYDKMVEYLDDGVERGMKAVGGESTVNRWKDLNERYAMSSILQDYGMRADGTVNTAKLTNYLMTQDPRRLLQGRGNRVSDFHQIARLHDIKRQQMGGGLGRENVDPADKSVMPSENLMQTPAEAMIPLRRRIKGHLFMEGYPSTKGLAGGLVRRGATSSGIRALEQGVDYHTEPFNKISEGLDDISREGIGSYTRGLWNDSVEALKRLGLSDEEIEELEERYKFNY